MKMLRAIAVRMEGETDLWQVVIERRMGGNRWVREEVKQDRLSHKDALLLAGKIDQQLS